MGYHGLYQINDMKLKPVELWLIKRLIAAVSSASCPPDSSASLSTPCGWQYHLSSRLSLTILSIQGWHYQTLDEDRHVSGVVYVDRHILSEAWNPGSHQIQSECPGIDPSPFFEYHWMCIPVSTLGLAQNPGSGGKNSSVFPFFFIQPVGKYGKMTHGNSPCLHRCIAREVVLLLFTDLLFNILHHIRSEAYSPLGCQ